MKLDSYLSTSFSPKLKSLQDLSIRIKAKVTEEIVDYIGL
jgi:hypothetical protein